MEKDISRIVNIVNDIQLAALGDVGPYDEREIYLADINKRIHGIEKGLTSLKKELASQK